MGLFDTEITRGLDNDFDDELLGFMNEADKEIKDADIKKPTEKLSVPDKMLNLVKRDINAKSIMLSLDSLWILYPSWNDEMLERELNSIDRHVDKFIASNPGVGATVLANFIKQACARIQARWQLVTRGDQKKRLDLVVDCGREQYEKLYKYRANSKQEKKSAKAIKEEFEYGTVYELYSDRYSEDMVNIINVNENYIVEYLTLNEFKEQNNIGSLVEALETVAYYNNLDMDDVYVGFKSSQFSYRAVEEACSFEPVDNVNNPLLEAKNQGIKLVHMI